MAINIRIIGILIGRTQLLISPGEIVQTVFVSTLIAEEFLTELKQTTPRLELNDCFPNR